MRPKKVVGVCVWEVCGGFFVWGCSEARMSHQIACSAATSAAAGTKAAQACPPCDSAPNGVTFIALRPRVAVQKKIPSQCKKGGMEPTTFRFRMKPFSNKSPPRHLNSFHTFPEKNTATTYRQKHLIQSFSLTRAPPLAHRAHRLRSRRARL